MSVALRLCGENQQFPPHPTKLVKTHRNILRISCYTGSIN